MVTWFAGPHAPEKVARIHSLLMQSELCVGVPKFSLRTNISSSFLFLLSLYT